MARFRGLLIATTLCGTMAVLSGCGSATSGQVQPELRALESAASTSTHAIFTARYRNTLLSGATVPYSNVSSEYSQAPPNAQETDYFSPGGATATITTTGSKTVTCSAPPSRCYSSTAPASDNVRSPVSVLRSLRIIERHVSAGQQATMSTRRIAGWTSYCFSGQAAGPPSGAVICYTNTGILAYFSNQISGTDKISATELTSYTPTSAV